jgi:hypothetical protein
MARGDGVTKLGAVISSLVAISCSYLALQPHSAQASHYNCVDGRTNKNTWFISGGVPSDWYTALINGVLVWDNIPGDSHNFVRNQGPPAEFNMFRGTIDGKNGTFAVTPADHAVIKFDTDEKWHLNVNASPGPDTLDLWSEAAHEAGHILSLAHSNACYGVGVYGPSAPTMFLGYDYGLTWKRTLETYDVNHEKALYP